MLLRSMAIAHFRKNDKKLHEIIPHLYLGSCGAAYNREGIQAAGVTHILCIATNVMAAIKKHNDELNLKYLEVAIDDKPEASVEEKFDQCFKFIEEGLRQGGVLVHCFQGKSRSSSIVIGYLMKHKGMSFDESLEFVRAKRSVVAPNIGFALQLRNFQRSIEGTHSSAENQQKNTTSEAEAKSLESDAAPKSVGDHIGTIDSNEDSAHNTGYTKS